jgi:hypothetical protein
MTKNKKNNIIIISLVVLSVVFCSLIWTHINLNFSNITGATGAITKENYSTDADTLRYIIFILLPLIIFTTSIYFFKRKKTKDFFDLIKFPNENIDKNYNFFFSLFILLFFVAIHFLSLNLPDGPIDTFHDGELFSVTKNTLLNNSFFIDTYTIHGFSDIFYPMLFWKITGLETIGSGRLFFFFLILSIKLFCLILSFQLIKFSTVKNKTIFFTLFSIILVSFSDYQTPLNFSLFSYRDIYIIVFLIFLSKIFLNHHSTIITKFFIGSIPTFALLMHIDTGIFLFVLLLSLVTYLAINKKILDIFQILLSVLFSSLILLFIFGADELVSFFQNASTIVLSMDYLHGVMYPEPFFSIGENKNGMRATRGLMLQLTAGLFVVYHFINKKENLSNGGKIFFVFLFFLSFIMYKNALGRSDSYHIRMSNDLPILINSFFIINFLIKKIETKYDLKELSNQKIILFLFIFLTWLYYDKINLKNIKDYNLKVNKLINLQDNHYIDKNRNDFIDLYKVLSRNDKCFQNFTDDLILLYLIKKPSCTKFVASWLASPNHLQDNYIKSLKETKPNFIVYKSAYFGVDGILMPDRLEKVNSYILDNYEFYKIINTYEILKIKS